MARVVEENDTSSHIWKCVVQLRVSNRFCLSILSLHLTIELHLYNSNLELFDSVESKRDCRISSLDIRIVPCG